MVALTVLIAGVVTLQAVRFMDALDFSGTGFGRDRDEIDVAYSMVRLGNGTLENDYILRLSHNRHPGVVYEVSIREEDIRRL